MKQKRVGLDMPMVCIVRKDGTEECGIPIGFRSKITLKGKDDPAEESKSLYIVFPFAEVSCDDIAEVYTFDEKGDRHGGPVNAPIQAHIHTWWLNREFTE